jgi:hypothetical protein
VLAPRAHHHGVGEGEDEHQQRQQEQRREEERRDEQRGYHEDRDADPFVQTLAVEHEQKRAEHHARSRVVLQYDDGHRQHDYEPHPEKVAYAFDGERVVAHDARHGQCGGYLGEFHGLDSHRFAEFVPRLRAVHYRGYLFGQHQRSRDEQDTRRIGVICVHVVVSRVEEQDEERRAEGRADPYHLLHVEVFEREDLLDAVVVRRRGDADHARRHEQQVEDDGYAVDPLEERHLCVVTFFWHSRDNIFACSSHSPAFWDA